MLYVLQRKGFKERILIGAENEVQMWLRLKNLLTKKPHFGHFGEWTITERLKMVDWCCWVIGG